MSHEGFTEDDVLRLDGLSISFDQGQRQTQAVDNLSFSLKRGETLAIVGESGSGKSVTGLSLMRLLNAAGSHIVCKQLLLRRRDNQVVDLQRLRDRQMRSVRGADLAMIFQEPMTSLNPVMTIGEQIAEVLRIHRGLRHAAISAEAQRLLEKVRIPDAHALLKRYPHQLSGGMRQRVMIAIALACQPAVLIADEPTTALDVTIQAQILQLIQELQAESQMGVIFITHDMGVVADIADRVMVMYRGKMVETGPVEQIFHQPQHPYTKALLASVPRLGAMAGSPLPMKFPEISLTTGQSTLDARPQNTIPPEAKPLLEVRDLVTRFAVRGGLFNRVTHQVHAVEGVSFNLFPGETLGLVGESGCGKSTTGRALLRLVPSQGGQIIFDGERVDRASPARMQTLRKDMQFIFQDPFASLDPRKTVGFSIMEPLLVHNIMPKSAARERATWLLEKVGLSAEYAGRYPHEFSGGQRQRICIARALALNPRVVIADEAVSALDVSIRAQIINLLLDLQRELGIAFLFISHDMAVVERISHRVAVMYLGQIVEIGPRQAIFENPLHPYTRRLMAAVPVADPAHRQRRPLLMTDEIPSATRTIGAHSEVIPLMEVEPGHFVARHAIAHSDTHL